MFILVPTAAIGTTGNLYLYAGFGLDANGAGFDSNDGFEEWSALTRTAPATPDSGSTAALLGFALSGMYFVRRKIAHS